MHRVPAAGLMKRGKCDITCSGLWSQLMAKVTPRPGWCLQIIITLLAFLSKQGATLTRDDQSLSKGDSFQPEDKGVALSW